MTIEKVQLEKIVGVFVEHQTALSQTEIEQQENEELKATIQKLKYFISEDREDFKERLEALEEAINEVAKEGQIDPNQIRSWIYASIDIETASDIPAIQRGVQQRLLANEQPIQGEKASDGKVHIEKQILNVPEVPRLCDNIDGLKKGFVQVDKDTKLYVEQEGKGEPILLLHGGPGATHHYFHPHFSKFKDKARIIYYDQRGCGLSDRNKGVGYSIDQAVDDLENLRKKLGIERWTVLGHSFGGLLAQHYAKKYPRCVRGLVLTGASPGLVNLDPGRDGKYISKRESQKIASIRANPALTKQQKIYNAFLNGDWKRQDLYKPTKKEMALFARYEWDHDPDFRQSVGQEADKSDLEGVFDNCPIPTLITEGSQDLTWNTDKSKKFKKNHPNARMVEFRNSAHNPFKDEPERFFDELGSFIEGLPKETSPNLSSWEKHVAEWEEAQKKSPDNLIGELAMTGGKDAYEKIAASYSPDWLDKLKYSSSFREAGFALYIVGNYEGALKCFKKMGKTSTFGDEEIATALIWQGHMLDLLGRRDQAIPIYQKVVDMNINQEMNHDQFNLSYRLSPYAAKRIKKRFTKIELQ